MKVKKEKSAGAIIFREAEGARLYLVLKSDHWGFPKGHVEKGEDETATILREVKEETGISDLEIFEKFREEIRYFFKNKHDKDKNGNAPLVLKRVAYYLGKTGQTKVRLSREHNDHKWLSFEEAYEQLTYKNYKKILKKAENFLSKNNY